ncbi:hypothetical protein [Candidatus Nitrosocosmicus hydrocola]|uniref:hypothetical protein n=1 Tax=Candidatus Nitrosocosmicus hydrocola TaxID=1826872 RepID=UPI0011E5FF28|nr:hypothetical protein [Candidatus Nitrosocosmicus hydrocola]
MSTENTKKINTDDKLSKKSKSSKKSHSDRAAFAIALTIILSYSILSFLLLLWLHNIEYFKDVSAIYGAWVGIAIGYFFGSRKVESLTEKIDDYMEFAEISDNDCE